jgi:hypothetical protein
MSLRGSFEERAPTLQFRNPKAGAKLYPPIIPLLFGGEDASAIQSVWLRVNGGEFQEFPSSPSNGFGRFVSTTMIPVPGVNTLEIKARDIFGNESKTLVRKFTYFTKAGLYKSLLTGPDSKVLGSVDFVLTELGRFTARILLEGNRIVCKGALNDDGTATVVLRSRGESFTLTLNLEADGAGNQLTGVLSGAGVNLAIDAARFLYDGVNTMAPEMPHYTAVFEPSGDPGTPTLSGFAALYPASDGSVYISGMLADGTRLGATTRLDGRGSIPLYIPLYKKGFLAGRIDFSEAPGISDFGGALTWRRPPSKTGLFKNGFETVTMALGSKNAPFPSGTFPPLNPEDSNDTNATVVFSGGGLASDIRKGVSFYVDPVNPMNYFIDGSDGTFDLGGGFPEFGGRFTDPVTGKKRRFQGVFFRKQNRTFGLFQGSVGVGSVTLEPENP